MGYRSEVAIGVAFENEADLKEVMAVYCLNPLVQKHDIAKKWKLVSDNTVMLFHAESVKWIDSYEDVQAYEAIKELAKTFAEKRNMPYAYMFTRIGEHDNDIEEQEEYNEDAGLGMLEELQGRMMITHPYIDINFNEGE